MNLALPALLLLLAVPFTPALAQQPPQAQADTIRQSCRADYPAHCASVPAGGRAALDCLHGNAASLSPACQSALAALGNSGTGTTQAEPPPPSTRQQAESRGGAEAARRACAADYRSLCRSVRPGGGRALACLRENEGALSPGCRQALASIRTGR
jgi:hypothetical protein